MKALVLTLLLFCTSLAFGQLVVPNAGIQFPNTATSPSQRGVCNLLNSTNFIECYGYDGTLHIYPDEGFVPDQLKASSSLCIGNCSDVCGSASSCIAGYINATTGNPTSGQSYCYFSSAGWTCSFDGGTEESSPRISSASTGHAVCWKTSTQLSYCTSAVGSDGTCTCH